MALTNINNFTATYKNKSKLTLVLPRPLTRQISYLKY
jgi:hypothetical protein